MGNVIQIKNGSETPSINQLTPYELGYVHGGALYINNNGQIVQLTEPQVIGFINANGEINRNVIFNNAVSIGKDNYGYVNPNDAGIKGIDGQLYFQIISE